MGAIGPGQLPVIMPHYPHMLSADSAVWEKFLADSANLIKEVWYDVHVGEGVALEAGADTVTRTIAQGVTRKRVDVVASVGGGYWVIEVKPTADMQALGQALTYSRLFVGEYNPEGQVFPVVVCDKVDGDVLPEFERQGVAVFVND